MWVVPLFDDDVDMEIAWMQHDVYSDALWTIVSQCNRYTEFARRLLDDANLPEWVAIDSFDHRTLQHAHDLLAAVWRFRNNLRQPGLPFVAKDSLDEVQDLWLSWLRREVAAWIDYPDRVRLVRVILANQNTPLGHMAESQLSLNILDGFPDVPWDRKLREASEASLEKYRRESAAETQ